ncbi:uncharacterized protein [Typha angustifolia]|uniref:uncharacterized protein n=1 Tax=Typha angustifolia TaxID=59011 RepID=UPI003C2FBEFD
MISEFRQPKREFGFGEGKEEFETLKSLRMIDQPELSLGPSLSIFAKSTNSSSSESDGNSRKKRKHTWDDQPISQTSVELQLNDPLPMDWEQCLDLQSGKMYYLNRKTLKKSWIRPKELDLNLELNISILPNSEGNTSMTALEDPKKHLSSSGSMIAVVCVNCHLLVMLCKSSPLCPNCKYVHSLLPPAPQAPPRRMDSAKSLETLSLLN